MSVFDISGNDARELCLYMDEYYEQIKWRDETMNKFDVLESLVTSQLIEKLGLQGAGEVHQRYLWLYEHKHKTLAQESIKRLQDVSKITEAYRTKRLQTYQRYVNINYR